MFSKKPTHRYFQLTYSKYELVLKTLPFVYKVRISLLYTAPYTTPYVFICTAAKLSVCLADRLIRPSVFYVSACISANLSALLLFVSLPSCLPASPGCL